ncbi:MAG TPA: VWA domain-containing protein [Acidimicrobiales bacterium]|nr:VWA domain-containing protein [Acidimicrobiales bacterium]
MAGPVDGDGFSDAYQSKGPVGVTKPAADAGGDPIADPLAGAETAAGAELGVRSGPERIIVGFAHALRAAGLAVPVGSVTTFAAALAEVGMDRRDRVYWAGRATLLCRQEDTETYDRVFASWWLRQDGLVRAESVPVPLEVALDDGGDEDQPDDDQPDDHEGVPAVTLRWSAVEVLHDKDFAAYDADEWRDFSRLVARMRLAAETRPGRRRRPDRHHRGHPDLRRTVRRALRTDGEPLARAWRNPGPRPRKVVLLVDVSGSMEPYARALLRFAHATVTGRGTSGSEVFTLGTRLTRITRELAGHDPDASVREAAAAVADWSGGTRLGDGLREFNDRWGVRGTARGAVVVVLSDGWDRGDPEVMAEQMARLGRVARRVVWVNPLKASPGYAPLARGMAAALPYVDDFVEGHSLAALFHLADVIAGVEGERRPQP